MWNWSIKSFWSQILQWPHKTAINGPHIMFLVPNLASSAKPKPISDKWCEPHIDQCSGSSYFWIRGDHVHCPSVQDLVFSHRSYLRENPEPTLGGLCRCDHTSNRSSSWGTEQVSELPASWLSALLNQSPAQESQSLLLDFFPKKSWELLWKIRGTNRRGLIPPPQHELAAC